MKYVIVITGASKTQSCAPAMPGVRILRQNPTTQTEINMHADAKTLIRRWFEEVWNQRRTETIDELLDENATLHGLGPDVMGRESFKAFHRNFCEAFGEMKITIDQILVEGDRVVAMNTVECKHTGKGLGFDPTHRPARFTGVGMARIANGKFVEAWDHYNFMELYLQLGVLHTVSAALQAERASAAAGS